MTPLQRVPKPDWPVPACPQNFSSLSCDYFAVNQSRQLVCDLGNPMKAGTSVSQEWKREGWKRAQDGVLLLQLNTTSNSPFLLRVSQIWGGLRFTVPHLQDTKKTIQFDFQILRYGVTGPKLGLSESDIGESRAGGKAWCLGVLVRLLHSCLHPTART